MSDHVMFYRWLILMLLLPAPLLAQKVGGSANVQALGHLAIGTTLSIGDIEVEQELSRPYAYISRINYNGFKGFGFHIISIANPAHPKLLYTWNIERPELHEGLGGADGQYFKLKGCYYYIEAIQFGQNGPDHDIAAVIVDVTSLPDTTALKEVARIHTSASANGFHNVYPPASARTSRVMERQRRIAGIPS